MCHTSSYAFPDRQSSFIQSMLDASMHGIILLEPVRDEHQQVIDFRVLAANAAIEKHTGITEQTATGSLMSEIYPEYKRQQFFDTYVSSLETGTLKRRELFYKDDRTEGWFDLGVAPHEDMLVVTFVNITDRKQYQQAIQRHASQLHTFIDTSQSGMFLFSPVKNADGQTTDFVFTIANRALAAYVGQEPETLIGEPGSKWFPAYKSNGLFELYRDTYETGRTNRFEFHYNADSIDVWLDIMSSRFENEVLVTFTDYTPIKKLQLQLEGSVAELKRSNTYLEEFAYAASHDLQEPLRKIQFYSDKIKLQLKNDAMEETPAMLERMDTAANRMRLLIDDLLAYSQMSTANKNLNHVDFNLLVKEVIIDLETAVKEKSAVISFASLPVIMGDKRQFYQLFQNLISNALKYSKPNLPPEISITSSLIKERHQIPEPLLNAETGSFWFIEVRDNGLGFEQQYARKIFHIFQRLHGRSEYPGTGVGLAIVQKVVENHKGYILADSEPEIGSSFKIWLPAWPTTF